VRILIAVHHFPPTFGGGAEWRACRTARGLQQAGHQVRVVCVDSITQGDGQTLTHVETTYQDVPVHRLSFNLSQSPAPFLWGYRNPLVGRYVGELFKSFRPHVLHLIGGYLMSGSTIEAAQALGIPTVATLTDFWFLCPRITLVRSDDSLCTTPADPLACTLCLRKERRRYRLADRWSGGLAGQALSFAWQRGQDDLLAAVRRRKDYLLALLDTVDVAISPSQFLKELFEAQNVSPRRFLYVRQGLDVSDWAEAGPKRRDGRLRIGYVGQIARHKGVDVLVEAFRRLRPGDPAPRLILYGDTEQFPRFGARLRKRVADQRDVVLAGTFEHSQIGRIHAGIDVLVVPSVWYENSPNVILEAFAAGTPVVVSRLGGMAELVTDGANGFQFEPGDAEALAVVLQRFVDRPDLAANLARNAPPVKTVQQEIRELLQIYTSLEVK
jgi:glycosyltransferase involved in cell wall biosynthesis